ncbi:MAG: amidohydrolase family protein [Symbiobacteriia bacterium]
MRIDVHAHLIPEPLIEEIRQHSDRYGVKAVTENNQLWFHHAQGYRYPVQPEFYDVAAGIRWEDRLGLDLRLASISPTLFFYDLDQATRNQVSRMYNEAAVDIARQSGGRILSMAAVPLPDTKAAIAELEWAVAQGLTGVEIGTNVERRSLDEPELFPFFQRCAELGAPVFLHPYYVGPKPMIERYYLTNSIGNPLDTVIAIANLIHSGVLERLPDLQLLLAHGGGFFPYQRGRIDHAFRVRQEPKKVTQRLPSEHLGGVYYDTITHYPPALRYLVETAGQGNVLLGSDHPFDMGPDDPSQVVLEAGLDAATTAAVLGGNAQRLYHLTGKGAL